MGRQWTRTPSVSRECLLTHLIDCPPSWHTNPHHLSQLHVRGSWLTVPIVDELQSRDQSRSEERVQMKKSYLRVLTSAERPRLRLTRIFPEIIQELLDEDEVLLSSHLVCILAVGAKLRRRARARWLCMVLSLPVSCAAIGAPHSPPRVYPAHPFRRGTMTPAHSA